jgi:hypothetical protein
MKPIREFRAFSLIEVIIAVGIFAGAVAVTIGLMAALSRQAADSADGLAAQRLPDALKVELNRLAASGFDNLAGQMPPMAVPLDNGFALVAPRDAAEVEPLGYLQPATGRIPAEAQYYHVECWRFTAEPLRHDTQKAFLALHVRVSWPYRLPGATAPVPLADRSQFTFTGPSRCWSFWWL